MELTTCGHKLLLGDDSINLRAHTISTENSEHLNF